jgi:hypothetical protein
LSQSVRLQPDPRALRAHPEPQDTSVVMLPALCDAAARAERLRMGADAGLTNLDELPGRSAPGAIR